MPPNDSIAADDFVFVDIPVRSASPQDVNGKSPVESGYVTVNADDSIIPANQDTLTASVQGEGEQTMLLIEGFQPISLSDFPKEIVQVVLIAPASTNRPALEGQVDGASSPVHPHQVLIKNATLLIECFLHFKDLYSRFGRSFTLQVVGKACKLNPQGLTNLTHQHIGSTLELLAYSRAAFLRMNKESTVPDAKDPNVKLLTWMVDTYAIFLSGAPKPEKMWFKEPLVQGLWVDWQNVLKNKGFKVSNTNTETAPAQETGAISERTRLIAEAVQAVGRLGDALTELGVRGGSDELSLTEKSLIEGATLNVKRWTALVNHPRRQ